MNKLLVTAMMIICLVISGCLVNEHTPAYEVIMQDIVAGKGILIDGEYSPTPGIKVINLSKLLKATL